MESQPQIPEFRINPENFHPCVCTFYLKIKQFDSVYLSIFHGLFYFCDCQDFLLIKMLFTIYKLSNGQWKLQMVAELHATQN